jgi:hypothetical protein
MSSLSPRQDIKQSYETRLLRVVIEVFDEFPTIPMIRVIRAFKNARATLQVNSNDLASPSAVGAAARQALRDRVARSAIRLGYPSTSPP